MFTLGRLGRSAAAESCAVVCRDFALAEHASMLSVALLIVYCVVGAFSLQYALDTDQHWPVGLLFE